MRHRGDEKKFDFAQDFAPDRDYKCEYDFDKAIAASYYDTRAVNRYCYSSTAKDAEKANKKASCKIDCGLSKKIISWAASQPRTRFRRSMREHA